MVYSVCMHAYLHIFMLFVSCHTAAILCTSVSFSVRYWLLHFMMVFVAKCLSIKIWTIVLCQLLLYIYFMKCYSLSHFADAACDRAIHAIPPASSLVLPTRLHQGLPSGAEWCEGGSDKICQVKWTGFQGQSKVFHHCQSLTEYIVGASGWCWTVNCVVFKVVTWSTF